MTNPKHTSSDLVERLRDDWPEILVEKHWMMDSDAIDKQREEAADRIEALEAENERLTARVAELEAAREPLRILLPLLKCVTLRQAVDAGIHDQLGWSPYALNEGADENAPALAWWKINAISAALKEDTRHD